MAWKPLEKNYHMENYQAGRWGGSINMGQQDASSDDCASIKYCLMAGSCKRHWKGSEFGGRKFTGFSGISVGLHFVIKSDLQFVWNV